MSAYESTFICSPELPTEKIDELVEKVKKVIETSEGKVALIQQLGRKRLAYPIRKFREGSYVYMELTGTGAMIAAVENFFKVNDTVIRYLTVKVEKKKKPVVKPVAAPATTEPAAAVPPVTEEGKTNEPSKPQTPGAE
jgi:small subunit ribosomal protein S6